jgi:transcriptional regulator with XRE-family HTH domain
MQEVLFSRGYKMAMNDLGEHLRELREAAGMSQRELAKQLEIHHSNLGHWERSGNLPGSNLLLPLAKLLGVTVEELLTGEASKKPRGAAITGKAQTLFEQLSKLPRNQQQRILATVEDMLVAQEAKAS